MFTKINGVNYIMDSDKSNTIYNKAKSYIADSVDVSTTDANIMERTIIELMIPEIASLAKEELRDAMTRNGFVTVKVSVDITFEATVGLINDKLVYGLLVK